MENLINETNGRLKEIINNLQTIGREYEDKLNKNAELIESEKEKANKYKNDFAEAEAKVNKMNADIQGFESDYNHLVEKFKDDELSNILIAANREISAKIDERKKKILKDQIAMNSLVQKAESVKTKLVKLYAEKKVLEYCYQQIVDAYDYYSTELGKIINYSNEHRDYLCECYEEKDEGTQTSDDTMTIEHQDDVIVNEGLDDYSDINMDIVEDVLDNPIILEDNTDEDDANNSSTEIAIEEPSLDEDEIIVEDEEYPEVEINDENDEITLPTKNKVSDDEDDDFIYIDNIELEEDEEPAEIPTSAEEYDADDLKEVLNATAKELDEIIDTDKDKEDLLSYLEITDEDLEKIINQSDDLED